MGCWHLSFPAKGRYPPFPNEHSRRAAVRKLVRVAGKEMALFCIVDDHLHIVVWCCSHRRAVLIGRSIVRATHPLTAAQLCPPHVKPVETRAHLERLVRYHLEQVVHHGLQGADPALWSGSCFQDMVGARAIDGLELRIAQVLPRFRLQQAFEYVGLPPVPLVALDDRTVRAAGATRIVHAAASALAVGDALAGRHAPVVLAKRAAVQTGTWVGISTAEMAWALRTTTQTIRRLKMPPIKPRVLRAVRLRLALEHTRASSPMRLPARTDRPHDAAWR